MWGRGEGGEPLQADLEVGGAEDGVGEGGQGGCGGEQWVQARVVAGLAEGVAGVPPDLDAALGEALQQLGDDGGQQLVGQLREGGEA